jgi:hypothetical protein
MVLAGPSICRGFVTCTLLFWIDTVCINQTDLPERAQQVRLMAQIYNKAVTVYVWIVQHEGNSELGINLTNEFGNWVATGGKSNEDPIAWTKQKLSDPKYEKHWEGFRQILERSY